MVLSFWAHNDNASSSHSLFFFWEVGFVYTKRTCLWYVNVFGDTRYIQGAVFKYFFSFFKPVLWWGPQWVASLPPWEGVWVTTWELGRFGLNPKRTISLGAIHQCWGYTPILSVNKQVNDRHFFQTQNKSVYSPKRFGYIRKSWNSTHAVPFWRIAPNEKCLWTFPLGAIHHYGYQTIRKLPKPNWDSPISAYSP